MPTGSNRASPPRTTNDPLHVRDTTYAKRPRQSGAVQLVAATLEADWNAKLRDVEDAAANYERQDREQRRRLDAQTRAEIQTLVSDFPRLWNDERTTDQDRKRMLRLLVEDVTLSRHDGLLVQVRFKGGACQTLMLPRPLSAPELRHTDADATRRLDELLEHCTDGQAADLLNREGFKPGAGRTFTGKIVRYLRRAYRLKSHYERLRETGFKTPGELASELGVHRQTVLTWRQHGLLKAYAADDKSTWLFEPLGPDRPMKQQGEKLANRVRFPPFLSQAPDEVHDAT